MKVLSEQSSMDNKTTTYMLYFNDLGHVNL